MVAVTGKVGESGDKNEDQLIKGSGTPRDTVASRKLNLAYYLAAE